MIKRLLFSASFVILCTIGCTDPPIEITAIFGDFTLSIDRTIAEFNGNLDEQAVLDLEEMVELYNSVEHLNFINATGDSGQSYGFQMANILRDNDIDATIIEDGIVEGAGTYFFLGGANKQIVGNGKIGVQSWRTDSGEDASTLAMNDSLHEVHISFLKGIGLSQEEAEDFYFFTLNAAAPNEVYYLSDQEIQDFKLLN